jgi:type II secretory pathway pseudopilin PulG
MKPGTNQRQAGFSTLEMIVVIFMSLVITAIAIPEYISTSQYLRIAGDLRALNGITAQAKIRAAANFTHARAFADLSGNTYELQVWNKTAGTGGCWVADGDPNNACITYTGSAPSGPAVLPLSQGDTFGFGTLTQGPTPGQTAISQATACQQGAANNPGGGSSVTNTACIEFNSRGIPINTSGAPVATGAFYMTNSTVVDGVTVSATGSIQAWSTGASAANWHVQ